jgi:hypothetical protein
LWGPKWNEKREMKPNNNLIFSSFLGDMLFLSPAETILFQKSTNNEFIGNVDIRNISSKAVTYKVIFLLHDYWDCELNFLCRYRGLRGFAIRRYFYILWLNVQFLIVLSLFWTLLEIINWLQECINESLEKEYSVIR